MAKAKKKAARGGKRPGAGRKPVNSIPHGYAAIELKNPMYEPFEIEEKPPLLGKGDKYAGQEFIGRVRVTLERLKVGQAFNFQTAHSHSWMRKRLSDAFPDRLFIVTSIPDNENAVRIYLKA